jgi:hypothetical protein
MMEQMAAERAAEWRVLAQLAYLLAYQVTDY